MPRELVVLRPRHGRSYHAHRMVQCTARGAAQTGPRAYGGGDVTSSCQGLTENEAERRLTEVGLNEPVESKRRPLVLQILLRFTNPLVAILIVASVASAVLRDFADAMI